MTTIFLAQFALPLVLICWMGLAPPRTLFGFCIQVVATAAALWAMALLGIWLMPPWWAPYAFGVAFAAAAGVGRRWRRPFVSALPLTCGAWIASQGSSLRWAWRRPTASSSHSAAELRRP